MNLDRIDDLLYHYFYPLSTDHELLNAIQIGFDLAAEQVGEKSSIELAQKLGLKLDLQSPEKGYFSEFVMLAAYEPDLPGIRIFSDSLQMAQQ
jgi:hypothetical protein